MTGFDKLAWSNAGVPAISAGPRHQCLWRGEERITLTPKAFAVLQYLVDRSGRLVTQKELLDNLWDGAFVQPEVLKSQILDIRNALGDDAKNPSFIETVPRRGYRFIAAVGHGSGPDSVNGAPAPEIDASREGVSTWRRSHLTWAVAALFLVGVGAIALYFREKAPAPAASIVRFTIPMPEGARLPRNPRFALSPDGKRLVFWGASQDDMVNLWVRDLDCLDGRVLPGTETRDNRAPPVWSPDSRYVAFNSEGKLKKVDVAGGAVQTLCDVPGGIIGGLMWTPDDQIVFGTGSAGVGIMREPDGRSVAYVSDESGRSEIYVRPFTTGATTSPGGGRLISNTGGEEVRWPRNGPELFYSTPGQQDHGRPRDHVPQFSRRRAGDGLSRFRGLSLGRDPRRQAIAHRRSRAGFASAIHGRAELASRAQEVARSLNRECDRTT